ncbi:MAG: 4a-hydroxytetrahydrobiopterin dehydratase [Methanoregula sp.]|jgi:4a-hydroxytetrahydrobiopterin dehydratase|nr:4a-hydroxytetrahydrobiopterin dehydratase [Methanoregula sp.]
MDLTTENIITYRVGSPPLTRKETFELLKAVPGWSLDNGHLSRTFIFGSSSESLAFINDVMGFSQQEGHLPDVNLREARIVEVSYYTYPAGGLTWNDFIMAAKLNGKGYGGK